MQLNLPSEIVRLLKNLIIVTLRLFIIISLKFLRLAQLIIFIACIFFIIRGEFLIGIIIAIIIYLSESILYQKYKNTFATKIESSCVEKTSSPQKLISQSLNTNLKILIREFKRETPLLALKKVLDIRDNILILLPHLDKMNEGDYNLHIVKKTVTDYLPKTLMSYSKLPLDFAENHKLNNGKTSEEILMEQLDILDEQIQNIVIEVNRKNAESLIIQGEFLKSKFSKSL
jgi:hypothetical protein